MEHAKGFIVLCHLSLALENMDFNRGLPIGGGGEDLGFFRRDGCIAVDDLGEHAAQGFQTQGQGRYVQKQQAFDLAAQHTALNSRADGDTLVRVDSFKWILAGKALNSLLHGGDSGRAAHQQNFV